jgi:hypothetical protein
MLFKIINYLLLACLVVFALVAYQSSTVTSNPNNYLQIIIQKKSINN